MKIDRPNHNLWIYDMTVCQICYAYTLYMYHELVMNKSGVNTVETELLFLYLITINQQVQLLQMSLQMSLQIHCMSVHNSQLL